MNDTARNNESNTITIQLGYYPSHDCNYGIEMNITMLSDIDSYEHQYNIIDLLPDTCYVIMLRAYSGTSYGPWSSTIARTTVSAHEETLNDRTDIQFK